MDSLMFSVALPIIAIIFLLVGIARGDAPMVFGPALVLGAWLMVILSKSGNVDSIVNFAEPLWVKIIIGVICSVIAGLILKAFFPR